MISTMTQFLALLIFVLVLNFITIKVMVGLMLVFLVCFLYQKNKHFFRLMRRYKWFYLVMLLIFVFNTPGQHFAHWPYDLVKPTYEGLQQGVEQVLRIALMLAALSLLLARNSMQQLISSIYCLAQPLTYLGLDVRRFAARLWLTLHYVEGQDVRADKSSSLAKAIGDKLEHAFDEQDIVQVDIEIEQASLAWADYIVIICMILILVLAYQGML